MRVLSSIIIFAVCAIVGVSLFSSNETPKTENKPLNANTSGRQPGSRPNSQPDSRPVTKPEALEQMPEMIMDAKIKDLKGKSFKLSDYKGKVVLLNLWATWCGPCRMEIPELVKISEEFKGQDVEIVGLNVSPDSDDADTIREFVDKFKISYTIAQADMDTALMFMERNGSIPQSFLITRDGKIYRHETGYRRTLPQDLRKFIHEALNL